MRSSDTRHLAPDPYLQLACPMCRGALEEDGRGGYRCVGEGLSFPNMGCYVDFLPQELERRFHRFLDEYQAVRRAEGWGSEDQDYYHALPYCHDGIPGYPWKIRARSFERLFEYNERQRIATGELVLDAGCGNGWLSYRLAQDGLRVAAVDISADDRDGLRACRHYLDGLPDGGSIAGFRADFDHLPFSSDQFQWVVFNASFHYSADYRASLCEALRVLKTNGTLAIVDSPTYESEISGRQMVAERKERFTRQFGFPSDALGSREFLTPAMLFGLGKMLGLSWKRLTPRHGWRWKLRPIRAALRGKRPPAAFPLWLAQKA